jgi:hypothetical protein
MHLATGQDPEGLYKLKMARNKNKTRLKFYNHQHCFNHIQFYHESVKLYCNKETHNNF